MLLFLQYHCGMFLSCVVGFISNEIVVDYMAMLQVVDDGRDRCLFVGFALIMSHVIREILNLGLCFNVN